MLIAHEAPLSLLYDVQKVTDFEYCLVHLCKQYLEYFDFFREAIKKGREVILDNCVSYYTNVRLANGSTEKMGKIVKNKLPLDILTINLETGEYESKKIEGWFEDTDREIEWYKVIISCAKHNRGGVVGTRCTEDHKFWVVNQGWLPCKNLKCGDKVLFNEIQFNEVQRQLILGSFLGDGSACINKCQRGQFTCGHSDKQSNYLELKRKILEPHCIKHQTRSNNTVGGFNQRKNALLLQVTTKHLVQIPLLFNNVETLSHKGEWSYFKKQYNKIIPQLSPLGLAFWYMDDGSLGAGNLSTFHLSKEALEEKEQILSACKKYFQLEANIRPYKNDSDIRLIFDTKNSKRLHSLVAQFIPVDMQYKLPFEFRNVNTFWDHYTLESTNKPVETIIAKVEKLGKKIKKYNIQVQDNHNYFADDVLVSNSLFELREKFDPKEFAYWIDYLKPQYYVIPDVWENCDATIESCKEWLSTYGNRPGKTIGVVQATTYEEAVRCYKAIVNVVDKVAFNFENVVYSNLFPHPDRRFALAYGRAFLLSKMQMEGIIDFSKPHHLLGVNLPQEVLLYKGFSFIETIDTSNPVVHGLLDIEYQDFGLLSKQTVKLENLILAEPDVSKYQKIMSNIFKFREWSRYVSDVYYI